jgi:hypothetical protein
MSLAPSPPKNGLRNALDLFSIARFEALLCLPIAQIEAIANKAGSYYLPFPAPPGRRWFPKKPISTKVRKIDNPRDPLKELQGRILSRLLQTIARPEHVKGGVKGRSLNHNIELHQNSSVLVTLDIKSFFPSISSLQVYFIWRKQLNCSPRIAALLTKLTTFERHLPQGSPTSTYLANLLLASIDDEIVGACEAAGVIYSTWVDDLAFSGTNAPNVIKTAVTVLQRAGLAVSHRKLKVMRPGTRKILNGIILGRQLNVPPKYRKDIRSGISRLRNAEVDRGIFDKYVRSMKGRIDYVVRYNRKLGERLMEEFNSEAQSARKRFELQ